MPEKSWALSKPVVGLIFRIGRGPRTTPVLRGLGWLGKYSRFWGWATPSPVPAGAAPSQTEAAQNSRVPVPTWSNVADWLRRMHAQADHQPADSVNQEQ